jgi:hypothetical protein
MKKAIHQFTALYFTRAEWHDLHTDEKIAEEMGLGSKENPTLYWGDLADADNVVRGMYTPTDAVGVIVYGGRNLCGPWKVAEQDEASGRTDAEKLRAIGEAVKDGGSIICSD